MKNNIYIINGPNINMIGKREKNIYGKYDINKYLNNLKNKYKNVVNIITYYNNNEGNIIDYLYKYYNNNNNIGYIINLGAYTHTSLAISDTIKTINLKTKIIEVHVSNIFNRESIRKNLLTSPYTNGIIIGFGLKSYKLAILSLI
ncbi:MAG: 3-dehydroquinate dehydratase [Flavobacteriales endosymbiont of Rhyzopertha dominica]|nr:MAG: 3-dehydroquinate dehydratase [Candidatus Shikimatogenerans bostrichidophilus]